VSSRDAILNALRAAAPGGGDAPPIYVPDAPQADLLELFQTRLKACGGTMARVERFADIAPLLAERWPGLAEKSVYSTNAEAIATTLPEADYGDTAALQHLDLAVVDGRECVAENAAVWVPAGAVPHRSMLYLAEHLVLIVQRDALLPTMHEAYANLAARGDTSGYFIAGPSKTSDIAQCLVIGAQGPRSCLVCVVGG
jgi:L-lactate dehydrogenase complex protein LldG